jgi:hypothetical protein
MTLSTLERLSDAVLDAELKRLAAGERQATVALVLHLAEMDRRRLHLARGFPSLFMYCRRELRLSEQAAYHRIVAARAVRRFPQIAGMLTDGTLSLSTLRLLAAHLTGENCGDLLRLTAGKGKRDVEELLAVRFPQASRPALVRKLPATAAASTGIVGVALSGIGTIGIVPPGTSAVGPMPSTGAEQGATARPPSPGSADMMGSPSPAASRPLAPPLPTGPAPVTARAEGRFEFRFTGNTETRDDLRRAQDMLRHAIPDGNVDAIMARALKALVAELARKTHAATDAPRPSRGIAPRSRTIPASIERQVWARDQGRCAYVGVTGRRCEATAFLQYHHVNPHGVGGPPTYDNISLRCRAHNLFESDLFYGGNSPRGEFAPALA